MRRGRWSWAAVAAGLLLSTQTSSAGDITKLDLKKPTGTIGGFGGSTFEKAPATRSEATAETEETFFGFRRGYWAGASGAPYIGPRFLPYRFGYRVGAHYGPPIYARSYVYSAPVYYYSAPAVTYYYSPPVYSYYYCPVNTTVEDVPPSLRVPFQPQANPRPEPPVAPSRPMQPADGTFPYDGGPAKPAPMPGAEPARRNSSPDSARERIVSIPPAKKYTYAAYGDQKTKPASDVRVVKNGSR